MKKEILLIIFLVLFALTGTAFAEIGDSEANNLIHNGTGSWVMCSEPESIEEPVNIDNANMTKGGNDSINNTFSYASGKTWYVDDDGGPGIDFTKIQDAVNAATAGDTIIVKDGTYYEQVKLTKQLTIEGENKPVINAAGKPENYGIFIDHTSGCVIRGLEIKPSTEVEVGIYLYYSHSNQIIDNIASNHCYGIAVVYSNDNVVNANVVYDNLGGIGVWYSTENNISDNIAHDNYDRSGGDSGNIGINYANNNDLINNTVSTAQNAVGIGLWDSDNCILSDNTARNSRNGIYISGSSNTSLNTNIMESNKYNFGVLGAALSDFIHTIDTSNTINGKPIYYLVNAADQTVDATSNAGYIGVVNSSNIVVENLNLSNNIDGVLFAFTSNSEIKNLNISNNLNGICLNSSYSNQIYHNVITGNEQNAYDNLGTNLWDDGYPSGGNYWGDYGGVDFYQGPNQNITGRDSIGDTPYQIPGGTGAKDNYPLMLASAQWGTPIQLTYNTAMDWWPSISGDGSKIAFCSDVEGDDEIFVINSDGTGLTQLTHNAGVQSQSISGDGSKIAFESYVSGDSEAFVFVINSDGSGLTQLTHNDCQLRQSISGDGNKIAFESYIDGDYEIFVINSNGTGLTQVTSNTTSNNRYPSITGDGSKIAFFSDVDGDYEIFVINSDGSGLTQLTHNAAFDVCPSISGDGNKVAFYSVVDAEHYYEIFVINSDGSGLTQLTYNAATDWCPSITGDGSKIAFQSAVDGDFEIFVIDSDGTGLIQLTHNAASDWWPSISSDGNKVAFHSDVDGDREIFVVSYTPSIPPTCAIVLQKNGFPIDNINAGEFFDIYVGGSTDDQSINEVRFSSDNSQDGNPTGEWTDWYDGGTSSGDWDATTKIKAWSFATGGAKEVWAEVKDGDGQTDKESANIYVSSSPTADACGPYNGNINEPIQFHGKGIAAKGRTIETYKWTFINEDNTIETVIGQDATHTWSTVGLYVAWLEVQDSAGLWSKCSYCMVYVVEPFTFVQITDVHIGSDIGRILSDPGRILNPYDEEYTESLKRFSSILTEAHRSEADFVIITGDLVEYNNEIYFTAFKNFIDIIGSRIPVYVIPGNHDRRDLLKPQFDDNLEKYHEFFPPPDTVSFSKHGYRFIGLDSGKDYNATLKIREGGDWFIYDESPEGAGLSDTQMNFLRKWEKTTPKIIFIHHPAINEENDTQVIPEEKAVPANGPGGNDACIAFNRWDFINFTIESNVQLVLTGHTHNQKFIDAEGNRVRVYTDGYYGDVKPLFVQTRSATKDDNGFLHGFLEVKVDAKGIRLFPHPPQGVIISPKHYLCSVTGPVNLHAYDSQGRHTGYGSIDVNIPDSFYTGNYNETNLSIPQMIILYNTSDDYKFKVTANNLSSNESFNLTIKTKTSPLTTISYINVSIMQNTSAEIILNQTSPDYTMFIDYDGNNITDETKSPDSIETDYAPTATIISPVNDSIHLYSNEIAFNGTGTDLEDGIFTNSSLVWSSNIDGYIGIGNTLTTTNLSAGTHIIELIVNDSSGQVEIDTVTITVIAPDLTIDASNISFSNPYPVEGENITINATIHNVGTASAASITVQFFDGNPLNGTQIGANQTIAMINAGENKNVSVAWNTTGEAGDNCIWVVVDPSDPIKEPDEENNQANKSIFVGASHVLHILNAHTDRAVYLGYEAVLINCVVENASGNISANVSADIEKPDGFIDNITLIEGFIGNYNGAFTNTSLSGTYSITIYANRTGFVDDTESLSFEVLDTTPPASITNMTNTSGSTWINWTWDNPPDPDFDYTLIYLNGTWNTITAKGYHLAEGLNESTGYEIETRTVDAEGNMNTRWVNQTAKTSENQLPIANFTYTPENPDVNQTITFNASNSTDQDGNITNYEWDFGDGNTTNTTKEIILHSYALAGNYNVSLTVTDNEGTTNTCVLGIAVSSMPDLVVTENWVCWPDNCTICYNITNIGNGTVPAGHNTTLFVDSVETAYDHVAVALEPNESYIGCFDDYNWIYTPPDDNIMVCADSNNTVAESNETNNCMFNTWKCGDIDGNGIVNIMDVRLLMNHVADPTGYPIEPWAGDVDGDGDIDGDDVQLLLRHVFDPDAHPLNCRGD